jgi:transposase
LNVVERTLSWSKGIRRLRYRLDQTRDSFQAFDYLGALLLRLRRLDV